MALNLCLVSGHPAVDAQVEGSETLKEEVGVGGIDSLLSAPSSSSFAQVCGALQKYLRCLRSDGDQIKTDEHLVCLI